MLATCAICSRVVTGVALSLSVCEDQRRRRLEAALQRHRVGAGGDVLQTLVHHCLGEHGGRVVPSPAMSLVLLATSLASWAPIFSNWFFELDVLGDRDAVVCDRRAAELLIQYDVASLGAERDLHGVGYPINPSFEMGAGLDVEQPIAWPWFLLV